MGAFGAALYAKSLQLQTSSLLELPALKSFTHSAQTATCGKCTNQCTLTINTFPGGGRFISGNQLRARSGRQSIEGTAQPFRLQVEPDSLPAVGARPPGQDRYCPWGSTCLRTSPSGTRFLRSLGYQVVLSDPSSMELYNRGRYSIPSDTVCYPAKLIHGHIENLLDRGSELIFYPCLTYNFDEKKGDNHFNCPVVAYYPELLRANVTRLADVRFLYPYFGLHRPRDFVKKAYAYFREFVPELTAAGGHAPPPSTGTAPTTPGRTRSAPRARGRSATREEHGLQDGGSRRQALPHRPGDQPRYRPHDLLLRHRRAHGGLRVRSGGAGKGATSSTSGPITPACTMQPNIALRREDTELVQLVSFGCGLDAITTDEVREIMEVGRQALHPDQNRRDQQFRRGEDPDTEPPGRHRRAKRGKTMSHTENQSHPVLYPGDEKDAYDPAAHYAAHPL